MLVVAVISYHSHFGDAPLRRCPALTRVCVCCILSFLRFLSIDEIDIMLLSDRRILQHATPLPCQSFLTRDQNGDTIFVAPNHQASLLSYHVMRNPVLQSLKLLLRFPFIHQSCAAVWGCSLSVCPATDVSTSAPSFHTPTPTSVTPF